jgi:hypothetical protein
MNDEDKKKLSVEIDNFDASCKERTILYPPSAKYGNRAIMYKQMGVTPPDDDNYSEKYKKEVTDNILKDMVENSFSYVVHYKDAKSEFGKDEDGTTHLKLWVPVTFKSSTGEVVKKKVTKTNFSIIKSLGVK